MNYNNLHNRGIGDAITHRMNAKLQARAARLLAREFYRRGRLTWDMKMELRRMLAGR